MTFAEQIWNAQRNTNPPDDIYYLWDNGIDGMRPRSIFERKAVFIRHLDEFYSFFKGGLK